MNSMPWGPGKANLHFLNDFVRTLGMKNKMNTYPVWVHILIVNGLKHLEDHKMKRNKVPKVFSQYGFARITSGLFCGKEMCDYVSEIEQLVSQLIF